MKISASQNSVSTQSSSTIDLISLLWQFGVISTPVLSRRGVTVRSGTTSWTGRRTSLLSVLRAWLYLIKYQAIYLLTKRRQGAFRTLCQRSRSWKATEIWLEVDKDITIRSNLDGTALNLNNCVAKNMSLRQSLWSLYEVVQRRQTADHNRDGCHPCHQGGNSHQGYHLTLPYHPHGGHLGCPAVSESPRGQGKGVEDTARDSGLPGYQPHKPLGRLGLTFYCNETMDGRKYHPLVLAVPVLILIPVLELLVWWKKMLTSKPCPQAGLALARHEENVTEHCSRAILIIRRSLNTLLYMYWFQNNHHQPSGCSQPKPWLAPWWSHWKPSSTALPCLWSSWGSVTALIAKEAARCTCLSIIISSNCQGWYGLRKVHNRIHRF